MKGLLQIALFLVLPILGMAQCPNVPEICNNGIDDDCDGFIDCFDGDCASQKTCEDFYFGQGEPECTEVPVVHNTFNLVEDWRSTVDVETRGTPIVGDIDGDGFPEVITHYRDPNTVYILDGQDGSLKATINADMSQYSQSPAIADVDRDGLGEIYLVQDDRTFSCYDHNGNPKVGFTPRKIGSGSTPDGGSNAVNPSFADFNGDGVVEVFMGNQIFDALTGSVVAEAADVYEDSKGSVGKNSHAYSAAFDILPDGFCSDCSGAELICGNVVYSVNVNTHALTEVSRAPSLVRDGKVSLADWDGDDLMDIVVTSSCCGDGGVIYIWNPRTQDFVTHDAAGNVLANNPLDAQSSANTQVGLASIADFDGDGLLEMAMAGRNEFFVIDNDMTKKWGIPVQDVSNMTTSTAFDFEGDGSTEIVYRDEKTLFVLDGATGAIKASTQCGSGTRTELPIVVDVDADGEAEIVCTCADFATRGKGNVRVYESDVNKWVPTRQVWNSHNYVPTFINDDLTIPREFQNKALIDGQDIYLSQTTLVSNSGGNIYPSLPDFVVEIDSVQFDDCSATTGTVNLTICNDDFNALIFDFDISYYRGDPTTGGALIGTQLIQKDSVNVISSRCMELEIEVPAGHYDLHVVMNDNGTNPAQAPVLSIEECDSTNNIAIAAIKGCSLNDFIRKDTIYICKGDSAIIEANNVELAHWTGTAGFDQLNDSTIRVNPTENAVYQVSNLIKKQNLLINGGFEDPNFSVFKFENDANVPGWTTTASDHIMEFWPDGMQGISSYEGNQFVELNANMKGTLYQDVATTPGDLLIWSFAHRGRSGIDDMNFEVGPPNGPYENIGRFSDGNTDWGYYNGVYEVPVGQTTTRFYFSSANSGTVGNFLDDIQFNTIQKGVDSIVVIVDTIPVVNLGNDTLICVDSSVTLYANQIHHSYLWNTGEITESITVNGAGIYAVRIETDKGCFNTDSVEVTTQDCLTDVIVLDTLEICSGDSIEIEGLELQGGVWNSKASFTLINDSTINANPDQNAWYYYGKSSGVQRGNNVIINGDFESGNAGFTSGYNLSTSSLYGEGLYIVGNNPKSTHNNFSACGDHTTGSGNMMIMNASTKGGVKVWCQNVSIDANTDYEFSAWITSVHSSNPAVLEFQIDGNLLGSRLSATSKTCDWGQYAAQWTSNTQTSIELCLVNQNTASGGNDFAIDDVAFSPVFANAGNADSILIIVHDNPVLDLGNDTTICATDSVELNSKSSDVKHLWSTSDSTASIVVKSASEYSLEIINEYGCKGYDTIQVNVQASPIFSLPNDTTICTGDSILISSNVVNRKYAWNTGDKTESIQVYTAGTYSVEVTDSLGCSSIDSMQLILNTLPVVDIMNDTTICIDQHIELNAGNTNLFYLWNTAETTQNITVSDTGIYGVEVRDSIGCLGSDSMVVMMEVIPDPYVEKNKWFCEGQSITLEPDPGFESFDIYWYKDPISSWIEVGDSGVYESVVSGLFCSDTFAIQVEQVDTPNVFILDVNGQEDYCFDIENTTLSIEGENGRDLTYVWDINESTDQTLEVNDSGVYWATVSNPQCLSRIHVSIEEYCKGKLFVPNSFTPNNDAVNDVFLPVSNGHIDDFEMRIYDRWGLNIFTTDVLEEGWNGEMKNGTVQNDVYVYKITYSITSQYGSEKTESMVGTVTVLK